MKSWTEEVKAYREKIDGMSADNVYDYLWQEYRGGKLSKKAHDWLVMWFDDEE